MAPNTTGRTTYKWTNFIVMPFAGTLRAIPVNSISACGLTYDEADVTAWQDAIKGVLPTMPSAPIDISGPFDISATAAVPAISGSHTVLASLVGGVTPLTIDIQIGMRHAWEATEPQFGITSSAVNGYLCTKYQVDTAAGTYSAHFDLIAGSIAPAFGTAAEA